MVTQAAQCPSQLWGHQQAWLSLPSFWGSPHLPHGSKSHVSPLGICSSPAPPSLARPGPHWAQLTPQPCLCPSPGICPESRAGTLGQALAACPCSITSPLWAPLLLAPQHFGMFISFWENSAQKTDIHFTSYLTECYWCKLKSALLQKESLCDNLCTTTTCVCVCVAVSISKLPLNTSIEKSFLSHSWGLWVGIASFSFCVFPGPSGLCQGLTCSNPSWQLSTIQLLPQWEGGKRIWRVKVKKTHGLW